MSWVYVLVSIFVCMCVCVWCKVVCSFIHQFAVSVLPHIKQLCIFSTAVFLNNYWEYYFKYYFLSYRRRKWQPTPVVLPGKSHGWRSLVGYSPWGHKESDTTEWLHFLSFFSFLRTQWWIMGFPGGSVVSNHPASAGMPVQSLGQEDSLE